MRRQPNHPHLSKFKEAKKEITKIYSDLAVYIGDCVTFVNALSQSEERFSGLLSAEMPEKVGDCLTKVKGIQEVVDRNQMKCAFFGRTSNGKSTVINAMLGSRVLPAGIGHTTSCFLQVEGTDDAVGYVLTPRTQDQGDTAPPEPHPVESVSQLAHSLSKVKLSTEALIHIFWPCGKCSLLREDVVFLDSPGIDVDPDLDAWIDKHCLDADVFILVANAESTLMQAEKKFFHKVSEKLSKPNIFILNNRWDASAGEAMIDQVREQHMQRCVAFLADELKECSRGEAEERVFFISGKEALTNRCKGDTPPSPDGSLLAEGWQSRFFEFTNFEKHFERILSESATKTKFAAHSEQGREITSNFRTMMEGVYETAVEEKDAAVRYRQLSNSRLEELRSRLSRTNQNVDQVVRSTLESVEHRVSAALVDEIRRLSELVEDFEQPFLGEVRLLALYKQQLNEHVERQLGRRLVDACAGDMVREVTKTQKHILERYCALVEEETQRVLRSFLHHSSFEPEFHIDCRNICSGFKEDLAFRFSLGWTSLYRRFFGNRQTAKYTLQGYVEPAARPTSLPHTSRSTAPDDRSIRSGTPQTPSNEFPRDLQGRGGILAGVLYSAFPSLLSRNVIGAVVVVGIVVKAAGWRVLGLCGAVYGGVYVYERLSWTVKAKERIFQRQFVDYASQKLRLIVDLTSTNASHQVKQELVGCRRKMQGYVQQCAERMTAELEDLDKDIGRLDEVTTEAKKLKNSASYLDNCLTSFHQNFILNTASRS